MNPYSGLVVGNTPALSGVIKTSIPARIFVQPNGDETLSNGDPLYMHPLARTRAQNSAFALHDACEIGDLFFVKAYFTKSSDNHPRNTILDPSNINRRDLYSQTPLHIAILNGRYEIAKILIEHGVDFTLHLEGMSSFHVLFTLIGSFPQYQIPMLQPTPETLQNALLKITKFNPSQQQQQQQQQSTTLNSPTTAALSIPTFPTPQQLILDDDFTPFQSYGIRMTSLLLNAAHGDLSYVYKRDDNGRTLFHLCAQYDLVEPFLLLVDRLFDNYQIVYPYDMNVGEETSDQTRLRYDSIKQKVRQNFCTQLMSQDHQHRNIFHYCAQYRSFHILDQFFTFLLQNSTFFPPIGFYPISQAQTEMDLFHAIDVYHRTPLHYAFYYAAPFYSRPAHQPLSQVIGKYYALNKPTPIDFSSNNDDNNDNNSTSKSPLLICGNESDTPELIKNRSILETDPIITKFLNFSTELKNKVSIDSTRYSNISQVIGETTSFDVYNRTPYQCAVLNQPVSGSNNAGSLISLNPDKTSTTPHATFKPTLIGWSPRCFEHHTAPKISRRDEPPPPENVRRLQVLLNFTDGILRSNEFNHRVSQTDILALNHIYYSTVVEQLWEAYDHPESLGMGKDNEVQNVGNDGLISTSSILRHGDITTLPFESKKNEKTSTTTAKSNKLQHPDYFSDDTIPTLLKAPYTPQNIMHWNHRAPRATFGDVLRCHSYGYVNRLMTACESTPDPTETWSVATTESIDVLHRDLHISVPNIVSMPLNTIRSSYTTAMNFYFKVLDSAREAMLLPPHEDGDLTNTMTGAAGAVALIKKKQNQKLAPLSNLAQNILYRERSLLNLNLGFANLKLQPLYNGKNETDIEVTAKNKNNDPNNPHAVDVLTLRDRYLGDAHEEYDSALFPIQAQRELLPNLNTGGVNWRVKLTPAIYTNSIIQSSSMVNVMYHYPNHDAIEDEIDQHTGFLIPGSKKNRSNGAEMGDNGDDDDDDANGDNSDENIELKPRQRTSTFSAELSTTNPAPSVTRHVPAQIPLRNIDDDTALSTFSWFAALFAGGTVIDAVKRVVQGQYKNAFCAVRPPGHHSGPNGLVATDEAIGDSHGFCLLNNVAMGAAYAKAMFPDTIKRIAIVDFDVHHGNGTEAIVRRLLPQVVERKIQLATNAQFGSIDRICITKSEFSPWHDSQDCDEVLFASTHGFYRSAGDQFYPGTGETTEGIIDVLIQCNNDPYRIIANSAELTDEEKIQYFSNSVTSHKTAAKLLQEYVDRRDDDNETGAHRKPYVSPILVDIFGGDEDAALQYVLNKNATPRLTPDQERELSLLREQLTHVYANQNLESIRADLPPSVINQVYNQSNSVPSLHPGDLPTDLPIHASFTHRKHRIFNAGLGKNTKHEWRGVWQHTIIPGLVAHKPDLIMISAGFDAHTRDKINSGHVLIDEDDYYWITRQLMKVANLCCEGRIVSCLEGGYRIHGGLVSPFARSIVAHVRALNEGGNDSWTPDDADVEVQLQNERAELGRTLQRISENNFFEAKRAKQPMSNAITSSTHYQQQPQHSQPPQQQQSGMNDGIPTTTTTPSADDANIPPQEQINDANIISHSGRSSRQRGTTDLQTAAKRLDAMKAKKKQQQPQNPTNNMSNELAADSVVQLQRPPPQ